MGLPITPEQSVCLRLISLLLPELYFIPTSFTISSPQQLDHLWVRRPASSITAVQTGQCVRSPLSVSVYHPAINSCRPLTRHTPAATPLPALLPSHSQHRHMFSPEHTPTHELCSSSHVPPPPWTDTHLYWRTTHKHAVRLCVWEQPPPHRYWHCDTSHAGLKALTVQKDREAFPLLNLWC